MFRTTPRPRPPHASLFLGALLAATLVPSDRLAAQATDGDVPPGWRVDRWTTRDGLPGDFIADADRAGDGYLWLLASGIPVRFDGVRFTPFPPGGTPDGPAGALISLAVGAADTVWLATNRGELVSLVDGRFAVEAEVASALWNLAADGTGAVVVAEAEGSLYRRRDGFTRIEVPPSYRGTLDGTRLFPQIRLDGEGRAWINGREGIASVEGSRAEIRGAGSPRVLPVDARTGGVLIPRPGPDSVVLVDAAGARVASYPVGRGRAPYLVDERGRLWTSLDGAVEVHPAERRPGQATIEIPLGPDVTVGRMLPDAEGNVWITTGTTGLLRVRETPFRTVGPAQGLPEPARQVAIGPDTTVWILDSAKGIYAMEDGRAVLRHPRISPDGPTSLDVAPDGTLWMGGTWAVEPHEAPRSTRGVRGYTPDGDTLWIGTPAKVDAVVVDRGDPTTLWFAADRVHRVDLSAPGGPRIAETVSFDADSEMRLIPRPGGGVWAVGPSRILRLGRDERIHLALPDSVLGAPLRGLVEDPDGGLWIGTYGGGLLHVEEDRVRRLTARDGLGEDIVSSLVLDHRDRLWMAGNRSVHAVDRSQARAFVDGAVQAVDGVRFAEAEGLRKPETTGRRAVGEPGGRLWFPTFGGAVTVDPDSAARLAGGPPPVRVEGVAAGDSLIRPRQDRIDVPEGVRDFQVRFTSTALRDGPDVLFEYRLAGIDADWNRTDDARTARYADVRGGVHRFEVRARSPAGTWSIAPATLDLHVPRTFLETGWSRLLLLGVLVGLAAVVVEYRTRASERRAVELEAEVTRRTAELREAKAETESILATVTRQREELKALDRAKDHFFANVTHELRTPLTLLLGPVRDLRRGELGTLPPAAKKELEIAEENGARILELVEQLLDVARLEAGNLPLRPVRSELRAFLTRVLSRFEGQAARRDLTWEVDVSGAAPQAVFDADCLEKVVVNLVGNAVKYTSQGGRVSVTASTRAEGPGNEATGSGVGLPGVPRALLRLRVADSGPGIPAADLDRIFERFQRVDERGGSTPGGSGIGLSLVKELVALMEGEIRVRSHPEEGTTFTVDIPVGGVPAEGDSDGRPPSHEPDPDAAPVVLVVEDHPDLRAYVRRHLEPRYRVLEAEDGEAGLELALAHTPDAVVSDVMMPGMDGEELCRRIRATPEVSFVPVILLTARSARKDRLSGLRQGADAYVTKPFSVEELLLTLTNQIASRMRLRERIRQDAAGIASLDPPWKGREDHGGPRFLEHLHRTLLENLADEELNPEGLARAMNMSRSTLYRRVGDVLGRSPMDVLWDLRLDQARAWLEEGEGSVAEVAYGVGFKSVSHFSRRFRERFGETPSGHRDG